MVYSEASSICIDEAISKLTGTNLSENLELDLDKPVNLYCLLFYSVHLHYGCVNSDMHLWESRLTTFSNWPDGRPSPTRMARAGFFYTQVSDTVRCFACQRNLTDWKKDEDPIVEHCSLLPNCLFAKLVRYLRGDMNEMEIVSLAQIAEQKMRQLSQLCSLNNDAFNFASKLGHNKDLLVSLVANKLLDSENTEKMYTSKKQLIEDAFKAYDPMIDCDNKFIPGLHAILMNLPAQVSFTVSANAPSSSQPQASGGTTEAQRLYEENMRLIAQRLCHSCYSKRANHVVLPCGHLTFCVDCIPRAFGAGSSASECPLCFAQITRVIRVYQ